MSTCRLLNTRQAAEYSGRHIETIYDALRLGDLHGSQRTRGGKWMVRVECLDAWVDGQTCPHKVAA